MMEILSKCYGAFLRFRQSFQWKREARKERKAIPQDNTLKKQFKGRCLVLIPHSDDEWIGCSRILLDNKDVILCNMDMTGGDSVELHQERFIEMSKVAEYCQHKLITVSKDKKKSLKKILEDVNPDFVFLPHYIDWHPEHIEVMMALKSAMSILDAGVINFKVVMYQVSCPIISGITHAIAMTHSDWDKKWKLFNSFYPTQKHIPSLRFSLNEVINGGYIGEDAAEVYCEVNSSKWLALIEQLKSSDERANNLKNHLGSISSMRLYIKNEIVEK